MVYRGFAVAFCSALIGCAGAPPGAQAPDLEARLDELSKAHSRLELRLEEVTRNLLVMRSRLDAQEDELEAIREATPKTAPTVEPPRVVRLEPPQKSEEERPAEEPGPASDLYRRAFNAYREGHYGRAILDFEEFLARFPDHDYADNAQYWVGESYYSQGEYEQAVVEFSKVLDRYPREAKASDAMLKIGMAYDKLGDRERARVFWERLVSRYPQSEAARQAEKLMSAQP